jgi:8-oxo-dGTP pyrophosphatase MutT (NUDIX family)
MPVKRSVKPYRRAKPVSAIRRVAAAVPVRERGSGGIEFLLVRTSNGARWTLPKGGRERGETLAQAAAREALEEAGASGRIREEPIAAYFLGNDIVTAFLLEVDATRRPVESRRKPTWFGFEAARAKLAEGREFLFDERMQRVLMAAERAWQDARRGLPPA